MECNKNTEAKKLTVDSIGKIPIISMMEHSMMPWGIRDNESKIVYLNQASVDFLNIPTGFDFEGRKDGDFPCAWSELEEEFEAHDRKAESSEHGAEVICTSYYGRNNVLEPYYAPKFPVYSHDGDVLGTVFYAKKFSFISVCDFFNPSFRT